MNINYLKVNCNISEFLIIGPKSLLSSAQKFSLNNNGHNVTAFELIRNVGVIFKTDWPALPVHHECIMTLLFSKINCIIIIIIIIIIISSSGSIIIINITTWL